MNTTAMHPDTVTPTGFRPLPLSVLRETKGNKVDVYQQIAGESAPTLLASRELALSPEQIDELQSQGFDTVLVRDYEYAGIAEHFKRNLTELLRSDHRSASERYAILQAAVAFEIEQALRTNNAHYMIAVAKEIARDIAGFLSDNRVSPAELFAMIRHDSTTFVHVMNVAGYLVLLARELGECDPVEELAVGAILHDFGKQMLPREAISKASRPNSSEARQSLAKHPQLGYEALVGRRGVSTSQLMMVYQHHERLDGSGYPVGILAEEIHPWAQMLAVVDAFDNLTADRPCRKRMTCEQALEFLAQEAQENRLNKDYVTCWASVFQPQ